MKVCLFALALVSVTALAQGFIASQPGTYSVRALSLYTQGSWGINFKVMTKEVYDAQPDYVKGIYNDVIGNSIATIVTGVRDQEVYDALLERLNSVYPTADWKAFVGKANNRNDGIDEGERLAIVYRGDTVELLDSGNWVAHDYIFHRSPVYAQLACETCVLKNFRLVGIHTNYLNALPEINQLTQLHKEISSYFSDENVLIGGDFNAAGLVQVYQIEASAPSHTKGFKWLIGNDVNSVIVDMPLFHGSIQRFLSCSDEVTNGINGMGRALDVQNIYGLGPLQAPSVMLLKPVEVDFLKQGQEPAGTSYTQGTSYTPGTYSTTGTSDNIFGHMFHHFFGQGK